MKFEVARKLATPGLWEYGNDAIWADCNGEGNSQTEIAILSEDMREINGRLLAHCYNHFDEVVKALEELLRENSAMMCDTGSATHKAFTVLAKAKEVK